jgi:flavin-dependent dehydrogenase
MIDPPAGTREGATLEAMYRAELAGTIHLARLLRGATPERAPGGLSASPYVATRFAGPGWALVGDAASFIDPLSSFGV